MPHEHSILVVDDDPEVQSALVESLQENGFRTRRAKDGGEALRKLRHSRRRPCLILLDLMMPGMTGWEFMEKHRRSESLSSVPLVLLTGWVETRMAQAKALIEKPIEPRRLVARLRQVLARARCAQKKRTSASRRKRRPRSTGRSMRSARLAGASG